MVTLIISILVLALVVLLYMFFISITLNNKVIRACVSNINQHEQFIITSKEIAFDNYNNAFKDKKTTSLSYEYIEINLYNYILFCFDIDTFKDYFIKHRVVLNK